VDWLQLPREDWHFTRGAIQPKGVGGHGSDDEDMDDPELREDKEESYDQN
jgi:hypothetical protein